MNTTQFLQFIHKALSILLVVLSCILIAIGLWGMMNIAITWYILVIMGVVGITLSIICKPTKTIQQ